MSGVQAAADFLMNSSQIGDIIKRANDGGHGLRNFEILLQTVFYPGGALKAEVLAVHIHDGK